MTSMSYSSRSLTRAMVAPIAIEPCGYMRATSPCNGLSGRSIQSRMTSNRSTALSWSVFDKLDTDRNVGQQEVDDLRKRRFKPTSGTEIHLFYSLLLIHDHFARPDGNTSAT